VTPAVGVGAPKVQYIFLTGAAVEMNAAVGSRAGLLWLRFLMIRNGFVMKL